MLLAIPSRSPLRGRLVVLSLLKQSPKDPRLDTWASKRPSLPPFREKQTRRLGCLYAGSCRFDPCIESAGVSERELWVELYRIPRVVLPTVAYPRSFVQSGGRGFTTAAEQDSCPRLDRPFFIEHCIFGSSTLASRHRVFRPLASIRLGAQCSHPICDLQSLQ